MKTTKFFRSGSTVRVISLDDRDVAEKLQPAVYAINYDKMMGYFLTHRMEKFFVPEKVYGSVKDRVNKVMATYESRSRSTGVLFTGDKGAGKTMCVSLIANKMLEKGIPVLLIEEDHAGTDFNEIVSQVGECCLIFDEFAKTYCGEDYEDSAKQDDLLGLLDGTGSDKRLVLMTENDKSNISNFLLERPGRIFYHFMYRKIDTELVTEYCADKGVDADAIEEICALHSTSYQFSFDVLQALVEEYLRFGGSVKTLASDLNIEQPIQFQSQSKVVKVVNIRDGKEYIVTPDHEVIRTLVGGTNSQRIYYFESQDDVEERNYCSVDITVKNRKKDTGDKQIFVDEKRGIAVYTELLPAEIEQDYSYLF